LEQGQTDRSKAAASPKHVWSIRTKLQLEGRTRDLAIFNLAIDGKLRGCDIVALKVEDIAPSARLEGAGIEYVGSWTIRVVGNRAALTLLPAIDPTRTFDAFSKAQEGTRTTSSRLHSTPLQRPFVAQSCTKG